MDWLPVVESAVERIAGQWAARPRAGLILGTGAAEVGHRIDPELTVPYHSLDGFPCSTAPGHPGQFVCGRLNGYPVIAMQGRFHRYEGYSPEQIRIPLEVMSRLGITRMLVSNAAGGLNPRYASGDLMVVDSHIDLMFARWIPANENRTERSPWQAELYDPGLITSALRFARSRGFALQQGVYAGLSGPTYETRAEYRFLRTIGADVAGMSTVPEVVFAARLGIPVLAISIVANMALPDRLERTSAGQVIAAARQAADRLAELMTHAVSGSRPPDR